MHLQPPPPSPPRRHEKEVICLVSDGEEDVQHTAGPSRASSVKSNQKLPARHPLLTRPVSPPLLQNKINSGRGSTLAGLSTNDRIKLEQERIARAKQRAVEVPASPVRVKSTKRGIDEIGNSGRSSGTGGVSARPTKTQRVEEVSPKIFYGGDSTSWPESPDSGCGTLGFKKSEPKEPVESRVRLGSEIRSGAMADEDEDEIMQYPDGVVKRTYLEGVERRGDDITIEEVLQKV